MLVWSGHSSGKISGCSFYGEIIINTGGRGPTKVTGNLWYLSLADSRQQVAARCAKQQAVECHDRWALW